MRSIGVMRVKHTHYLVMPDGVHPADVPALVLALNSRGLCPILGLDCFNQRLDLADVLGDGALAELLGDLRRPIVVTSAIGGYVFEEVS
jgi:hypothetical protein